MRVASRRFAIAVPFLAALAVGAVESAPLAAPPPAEAAGTTGDLPVVRLTPRERETPLRPEEEKIPFGVIAPFLDHSLVADSDTIERAQYVVGFPDEHIVAGVRDAIYVRRIDADRVRSFEILRPGAPLRDPETNDLLGYEVLSVGDAVLERPGDPARLLVTSAVREIAIGDRVIPAATSDERIDDFIPRPAPPGIRARILSVLNGVSQIGRHDVVIINRGRQHRLERGHLLEIHSGGEPQRDQVRGGGWDGRGPDPWTGAFWYGADHVQTGWRRDELDPDNPLPPHVDIRRQHSTYVQPFELAGELLVFRTLDRVSFALVRSASRAIRVGDPILSPPAATSTR